jgi:hypothetical protein
MIQNILYIFSAENFLRTDIYKYDFVDIYGWQNSREHLKSKQ